MDAYFKGFGLYEICPDFYFYASELYRKHGNKTEICKKDAFNCFQRTLFTIFKIICRDFMGYVPLSQVKNLMTIEKDRHVYKVFPKEVKTLEQVLQADRLTFCKWFYNSEYNKSPDSTSNMTEIGTRIYFAYPYIRQMVDEVIKRSPKKHLERR